LYIYVDDQCINEKVPIGKGEGWSYPVNNGVHYIYGKCGKLTSDAINFTADSTTLSFSAEIVKESRQIGETKLFKKTKLFGITKLVINRSEVSDDTGRQTDQDIQESYGNIW
jgi:hypothetical protein